MTSQRNRLPKELLNDEVNRCDLVIGRHVQQAAIILLYAASGLPCWMRARVEAAIMPGSAGHNGPTLCFLITHAALTLLNAQPAASAFRRKASCSNTLLRSLTPFQPCRATDLLAKLTKPGMRPDTAIPLMLPGEVCDCCLRFSDARHALGASILPRDGALPGCMRDAPCRRA